MVESVLCVPDADLDDYECRYARYLQRPALSDGQLRIFDLGRSSVVIVAYSALGAVLPGEVPAALPAFVATASPYRTLLPLVSCWSGPTSRCGNRRHWVAGTCQLKPLLEQRSFFTPLTVPKKSADQELLGSPHACLPP